MKYLKFTSGLSIVTKLFLGFAGVISVFVIVSFYSAYKLQEVAKYQRRINQGYLPLSRIATQLETLDSNKKLNLEKIFELQNANLQGIMVRLAKLHFPKAINENIKKFKSILKKLKSNALEIKEQNLISKLLKRIELIEAHNEKYNTHMETLQKALLIESQIRISIVVEQIKKNQKILNQHHKLLSMLLDKQMEDWAYIMENNQNDAVWVIIFLLSIACLIALFITLTSLKTMQPFKKLTEAVKRVAKGEYDSRVNIQSDDELGILAREFNNMASTLKQREEELKTAYNQVQNKNMDIDRLRRFSENIVNSMNSGIIVLDIKGKVSYINKAAKKLWNLSDSYKTSPQVLELKIFKDSQRLYSSLQKLYQDRRSQFIKSLEPVSNKSDSFMFDVVLAPLKDENSMISGVLIIGDDVTQRNKMEQSMLQSERLAAIGRLTAQVTHEIRNPLNSMSLNTDLLKDEMENFKNYNEVSANEAVLLLDAIETEIDRLTEITEQYLNLARLPGPKLESSNINNIIENLTSFLESELHKNGIQIITELFIELPDLQVDESQLRQVLMNLIRNSTEAMPKGGSLSLKTQIDNENRIILSVSDNGPGVEDKLVQRIFEPFFSTNSSGTGLGLFISRQIIREHGGELSYEHINEGGARFNITLPID